MELVYLWVKENDLIEGTNFNFGSKYIFSFEKNDEKKGVLSVEENPSFIENFYTDKISISAIVGKNGTGKSQLLKLIWNGGIENKQYFAIFKERDSSKFIGIKTDKKFEISVKKLDIKWINKSIDTLEKIFYTNEPICFESTSIISKECFFKKTIDEEIEVSKSLIKENLDDMNYLINSKDDDDDDDHLSDIITNIEIEIDSITSSLDKFSDYNRIRFLSDSEQFEKILNIIFDEEIKWFPDMNIPTSLELSMDKSKLSKFKILNTKRLNLMQEEITRETLKYYTKLYDSGNDKEKEFSSAKDYFDNLEKLGKELKDLEEKSYSKHLLNLEIKKNKSSITEIVKLNTLLVKEVKNIKSILNFNLVPKMSSGNLAILQTFAMLYDKINDIQDNNNILLLLDEVEVYLHPNWQKKFLNLLIVFLSSKFKDKNFHIILATHSPFLLSDIPKSNVVFLSDDEEIKIERTFGANIHTLLSDSFFMTDGLMGEFAKDKIQKIMNFLNNKDEIEKFHLSQQQIKLIIENIGEDLLRIKLLDMYYDKFEENELEKEKQQLLKKKEEIKELIKSIEEKQKQ